MTTMNPPCRDCGERASQGAPAIRYKHDDHGAAVRTISDLSAPLQYCTVCVVFQTIDCLASQKGARLVGHDMVER